MAIVVSQVSGDVGPPLRYVQFVTFVSARTRRRGPLSTITMHARCPKGGELRSRTGVSQNVLDCNVPKTFAMSVLVGSNGGISSGASTARSMADRRL